MKLHFGKLVKHAGLAYVLSSNQIGITHFALFVILAHGVFASRRSTRYCLVYGMTAGRDVIRGTKEATLNMHSELLNLEHHIARNNGKQKTQVNRPKLN